MKRLRGLFGRSAAHSPPPPEEWRSLAETMFTTSQLEHVVAELCSVGMGLPEQDAHRVRLAVVKLSEGSEESLRTYAAAAKADFRDVLFWVTSPKPTPEKAVQNAAELDALLKKIADSEGQGN